MLLGELSIQTVWLCVGTAAQGTILVCLILHLWMSKKAKRFTLPLSLVYVCLLATGVIAVYAAFKRDFVFVAGQLVNLVVGLRILEARYESANTGASDFPEVAPDRAEADSELRPRS